MMTRSDPAYLTTTRRPSAWRISVRGYVATTGPRVATALTRSRDSRRAWICRRTCLVNVVRRGVTAARDGPAAGIDSVVLEKRMPGDRLGDPAHGSTLQVRG